MTAPKPQIAVIFGASGDLTHRKILPAFYNLLRHGSLPEQFAILGYARSGWDDARFRERARQSLEEFTPSTFDQETWKRFEDMIFYQSGPFDEADCFTPLWERLDALDRERGTESRRLYYAATPPSAFPLIVERVGECAPRPDTRLVIEKPFGRDLESARRLNDQMHEVFDERQIFRIDHYLGKETVQNILVFRFGNALFERVWNRDAIDHVQITVAEKGGIEGRGAYYTEAGALRDIVQNHVLQVLAFLTMEPPRSFSADAVRDETLKVLRSMRPMDPAAVVRGQYEGFLDEEGVPKDSLTETYFAARAEIDNWRWSGVPFFLRTGKRLPRRVTEITIRLRSVPVSLFESAGVEHLTSDHLTIRIQPNEGISLAFNAKRPGPGFEPEPVRMDFDYDETFGADPADAYERLLLDALEGDGTLFTREDGVERAWEVVEPLLADRGSVCSYASGSWGPKEADDLIAPRT
ncbi:MAG TPA: glucose-6-phosphate dehydrogenase, partial [Actinomycetota bacterium]|nr:glucose-6-phosphate dehydrogenase [Actinomycetota bacterium]